MKCPDCNVTLDPVELQFFGDSLSICPKCEDEFITPDEKLK